ncbi:uncharacterized protein BDV14DRAFT_152790 [Aspergillus stella-maris]|uniref:uncharacterized protein n=1 Tax=Aspergillus stella-maris TaxID=1810926 RepID=UPI003CCCF4F3
MHLTKLTLALLPLALTSASASATSNDLLKRGPSPLKSLETSALLLTRSPQDNEVCASDQKRCGNACVNEDFDCCPSDVSGGCPSDETCMEDNGVWGCCDDGDNCSWDDDDNDNNDNDDDDDGFLDEIQNGVSDLGDDISDGVDDIFDDDDDDEDAAGMLRPGVTVALLAAVGAVVWPL